MTTAFWCVLIVIFLPIVLALMGRLPTFTFEGNLKPRIVSESFTGVQQRIYWAHQNALEVVAPFAAAVIIAHQLGVAQDTIEALALTFIGFRLAHVVAYVANLGVVRTLMFIGSMGCILALFLAAA